jgi:hypothetical protein
MEISPSTKQFISLVEEFSSKELNLRTHIEVLIEISSLYDGQEELKQLLFESKILNNLWKKIQHSDKNAEGIELIQKEFESSVERTKESIIPFLERSEGFQDEFNNQYFNMTKNSILNLSALSGDLSLVKILLDHKKSDS